MYTGVPPWQGMRRTQVMFKVTALGATLQIPPNCPTFYKVAFKLEIQGFHQYPSQGRRTLQLVALSRSSAQPVIELFHGMVND